MTHPIKWIRYKRLIEKWPLDRFELDQIIDNSLLPVYYDPNYNHKYHSEFFNPFPVSSLDFADYDIDKLFFKQIEIAHFEETYPELFGKKGVKKRAEATEAKKRPNQLAKEKCQEEAKKLWEKHYIQSGEMADRLELIEIAGEYTSETRRRWICKLAPLELQRPGRPPKK